MSPVILRSTFQALPDEEARTAQDIVRHLSSEPYAQCWVAVPVRGSRQALRRELQLLGQERRLAVETRIHGATSILVRVGGVRR